MCRIDGQGRGDPTRALDSASRYRYALANMFLPMGSPVRERRPVGGTGRPAEALGGICRRGGNGAGFRENCLSLRF
jgi:hypothetical protein